MKRNLTVSPNKGLIYQKEAFLGDEFLDDDEFFMAEEVEGYDQCSGYNSQKCLADCSFPIVVPTIVTLN